MIFRTVPIKIFDLVEQRNGEITIEVCVVFVGYANRDGVGGLIGLIVEGVESSERSVRIQTEQVSPAKEGEGVSRVGIRVSGGKLSDKGSAGLVLLDR